MTTTPAPAAPKRRIPPWLLFGPIVVFTVLGIFGGITSAALVKRHPLLLIFLNPQNRFLIATANEVAAVPYYLVASLRLVVLDPLYYLVGRQYGDAALRWMEKQLGDTKIIRGFERFFAKASYPAVLIAPNQYICLLAGHTGMPPRVFIPLNLVGTAARLVLLRYAADALEGVIDPVVDFVDRYRWWIIGISVAAYALGRVLNKAEPIKTVGAIEHELEEAEAEVAAEATVSDIDDPNGR